ISMEYVQGRSLREILEELGPGRQLALATVLRIFSELAQALEYAHKYTVHRDIKPENVMVCANGSVKLMDFGISKLMANPNFTAASLVMGTPQYMSPEQLRNSAKVDGRADIYSVGIMLYEILVGIIPVAGPKPMAEVAREVPSSLDPIIRKCLEADPDNRYPNATELRRDIDRLRSVIGPGANVTQVPVAVRPRHPWRAAQRAVGVALLVLIACGMAAGIAKSERTRRSLASATSSAIAPENSEFDAGANSSQLLAGAIEQARSRANAEYPRLPAIIGPVAREFLDEADAFRNEFLAAPETESGRIAGDRALERYVAVALWPTLPGTAFVPSGEIVLESEGGTSETIHVGPFFIDAREVTAAEYAEFARGASWRWADTPESDTPIMRLVYYDAQAFAARQTPPKQIPEYHQLARAIDYANAKDIASRWPDVDSANSDREPNAESTSVDPSYGLLIREDNPAWTRTPLGDAGERPRFGSVVRVIGGRFDDEGKVYSMKAGALPYENGQNADVVFRCVYEVPPGPAGAMAVISSR
ncbi:MAG: protein kinase, partial [Candidatus Hydrogenedentota bacterium]